MKTGYIEWTGVKDALPVDNGYYLLIMETTTGMPDPDGEIPDMQYPHFQELTIEYDENGFSCNTLHEGDYELDWEDVVAWIYLSDRVQFPAQYSIDYDVVRG